MNGDFSSALAHVLSSEGGYVRDPLDPGGATDEGVTQHVYDNWRIQAGLQTRDVRMIDPNEVEAIYRNLYWLPVHGDQLPSGVDYCVFDAAVNSGAHRASCWLQQAAGTRQDGFIGPATLTAVKAADPKKIINLFSAERLAFLESLPTWPHFGNGWSRRVASVQMTARGMT